jgi:hypothetical protein
MNDSGSFHTGAGYSRDGMRRTVLAKLGHGRESLDSAWAELQAHPSKLTYEELIRYVPKPEGGLWHERAMWKPNEAIWRRSFELWLKVRETGRLAERLTSVSDRELEELSHFVTEPAAKALTMTRPDVAA